MHFEVFTTDKTCGLFKMPHSQIKWIGLLNSKNELSTWTQFECFLGYFLNKQWIKFNDCKFLQHLTKLETIYRMIIQNRIVMKEFLSNKIDVSSWSK